jgi:hypothetical protein
MVDWAIITGEYPPQTGGVSDYTRQITEGLIDAGEDVVVFAPNVSAFPPGEPSYVRRLPGGFGPRGLWSLGRQLTRVRPRRILLQYTPHAFGWKAANVPLCLLLSWRGLVGRGDVRVMFHEVALPFGRRPLVNALAVTQRMMAKALTAGARRVYLSTSSWTPLVGDGHRGSRLRWLPIPANVPSDVSPAAAAAVRCSVGGCDLDAEIVGHFGTYGDAVTPLLRTSLSLLLERRPQVRGLLIGRGAERFRRTLVERNPAWSPRVVAAEDLAPKQVAAHLKACDLVVQPYPDGVSTRRTTAMAGLACGTPVVTNLGALSESLWTLDAPAAAVRTPAGDEIAALAARLLDDPTRREKIGKEGRAYYDRHFAVERSIDALRRDD